MSTYEAAVCFIEQINKYATHPGVENASRLLELLGHPEEALSIIHVAGTNGKGSVCAFLADMLTAQGFDTGLFISPHLIDIRERIQRNRKLISREDFAAAFDEVQAAVQQLQASGYPGVTYFDYLFAMAMCYYRKAGVDYVVMETGLGGRYDSTNAIQHPLLTIITSISFDHTEILGDTLAKIAYQKAGILKPGVPLIYCADQPEVEQVLIQEADRFDCPRFGISRSDCTLLSLDAGHILYAFTPSGAPTVQLSIATGAIYQMENSAIAYTAALLLNKMHSSFTPAQRQQLQAALAKSHWEGRLEQVAPDVFIDGAHNSDGIGMLLSSFALLKENRPATLLFTAVKEKDTNEMIREICESGLFDRYLLTTLSGPRALSHEALKAQFRQYTDAPIATYDVPIEAFEAGLKAKQPEELLLAAGSLYLVGEIKEYLQHSLHE